MGKHDFLVVSLFHQSLQPVVSVAYENEDVDGVMAPVIQIMFELHDLCEDLAPPHPMVHLKMGVGLFAMVPLIVDSLEASAVPLPPAPPSLQPTQTLSFVNRKVWTMLSLTPLSPSGMRFLWMMRLLLSVLRRLFLELSSPKKCLQLSG